MALKTNMFLFIILFISLYVYKLATPRMLTDKFKLRAILCTVYSEIQHDSLETGDES